MELYHLSQGGLIMRRFFVPPEAFGDGSVTISGDLFHHMSRVLRMKQGDQVLLSDGTGHEFSGAIGAVGRESLVVSIRESFLETETGKVLPVTLYQGLPKGDKMDLIVQKSTELGVAEIVPFHATRSVSRIRKGDEDDKVARWQKIALEAARQSGRSSIPRVSLAGGIDAALNMAGQSLKLLLWEEERNNGLKEILGGLRAPESVALMVGPEGGMTLAEAAHARECGFIPVSLGSRIVRTETASLAALAILQFYWGDLG
jgi:16S rRNA (uracil1498-N3)-methyltransferase